MRTKFFFGIAAMILLASCEESFEMETNLEIGNPSEVFTASTESEQSTRTSLSGYTNGDGCYSLYWSEGDAISISDGVVSCCYNLINKVLQQGLRVEIRNKKACIEIYPIRLKV